MPADGDLGSLVDPTPGDDDEADLPYPGDMAEPLRALPAAVRAQQLALALARRRGVDPDSPPGLRKVTPTR